MVEVKTQVWAGKRVLITGHTGFVGSWLALSLIQLGAIVVGYSNKVPTEPSLFEASGLRKLIDTIEGDIRDFGTLLDALKTHKPQYIFHLAAQPLVKESYEYPLETYEANILGTVNLFESVRVLDTETVVVNMTSDKCYESTASVAGYREEDPMGGKDPYSSSKACSELITRAYRDSFFSTKTVSGSGISLCSIRAGNIIGGGDWAKYRLIPDCVRAFESGDRLWVRYPRAVRPWQHVLDVINGFLLLAEKASEDKCRYCQAWNIGPDQETQWSVEKVVKFIAQLWNGDALWEIDRGSHVKEEVLLTLDNTKAKEHLGWKPVWDTTTALQETIDWYSGFRDYPNKALELTHEQINRYFEHTRSL